MKKFFKSVYKSVNTKFLLLSTSFITSSAFAGDGIMGQIGDNSKNGGSFLKNIISNSFIKIILQAIIVGIIIFALFNISKEFLGGQQGGQAVWKNLGAIIFAGLMYYILFLKLGASGGGTTTVN